MLSTPEWTSLPEFVIPPQLPPVVFFFSATHVFVTTSLYFFSLFTVPQMIQNILSISLSPLVPLLPLAGHGLRFPLPFLSSSYKYFRFAPSPEPGGPFPHNIFHFFSLLRRDRSPRYIFSWFFWFFFFSIFGLLFCFH